MRRYLPFLLLLTTSLALADDTHRAQHAAGAAKAQAKTAAVQGRAEPVQTQTEKAPDPSPGAQTQTKEAKENTGEPQADKVPGDTQSSQTQAQSQTQTQEAEQGTEAAQTAGGAKLTSVPGGKALGMSILGNQDAPKSLVIVPWKTSELGRTPGISPMLDDSRQPVDKEVFMRSLRYYEIRSEKKQ
jgi:hypothetical protein